MKAAQDQMVIKNTVISSGLRLVFNTHRYWGLISGDLSGDA